MRLPVFVCSLLLAGLVPTDPQAEAPLMPKLQQLLTTQMLGTFPSLRPAKSIETTLPDAERVRSVHSLLAKDIDQIVKSFESRSSRADSQQELKSFIHRNIDKQLANNGASTQFFGLGPTLIVDRQLVVLWIPPDRRENMDWTHRAISLLSSFERTPQPDEELHESGDPGLLITSDGAHLRPSSHTLQPAMSRSKPMALKKCRNYSAFMPTGNVCVTTVYQQEPSTDFPHMEVLAQMLVQATGEVDASPLLQPQGLTSLWISYQSSPYILLYKVSARILDTATPSFETRAMATRLNNESYSRLLQRLEQESKNAGFSVETW